VKDESLDEVIESFVGIRSKCYTFKTKNNVVKKAKGVDKVVVKKILVLMIIKIVF
jgi:hypothetical protein